MASALVSEDLRNEADSAIWRGLTTRRSTPPALLAGPGPSRAELMDILSAASRVPDHGLLVPWRFIVVDAEHSHLMCEKLCAAHTEAEGNLDPAVTSTMIARLRTWLIGPPVTVFLISCPDRTATIAESEQVATAAAVATTLLHAATAKGFGSIWLTGWPAYAAEAHAILGVGPGESVVGLFPIGKPLKRPAERQRPEIDRLVSDWTG